MWTLLNLQLKNRSIFTWFYHRILLQRLHGIKYSYFLFRQKKNAIIGLAMITFYVEVSREKESILVIILDSKWDHYSTMIFLTMVSLPSVTFARYNPLV